MSDRHVIDELPFPENEVRSLIGSVAARGALQSGDMTPEALRQDVDNDQPGNRHLSQSDINHRDHAVNPDRSKARHGTAIRRRSYAVAAVIVVLSVISAAVLVHSHPSTVKGSPGKATPGWRLASMVGPATQPFTPTPGNAQSPIDITCPTATICYVTAQTPSTVPGAVTGNNPSQPVLSPTMGAYGSTDAGRTWKPLSLPPGTNLDTKFTCPSATTCMAGSQASGPDTMGGNRQPQLLLTTTDGGATWSEETIPLSAVTGNDSALDPSLVGVVGTLNQLTCFSASTCVAFGLVPSDQQAEPIGDGTTVERSVFVRTDDGGATWTTYVFPWVANPDGSPAWSNAQPGVFASATSESCVGFSTVLSAVDPSAVVNQQFSTLAWHTDDGGITWSQAWLPNGVQPSLSHDSISCSDALDCVSVQNVAGASGLGASVVEVTSDGGITWTEGSVPDGVATELFSVTCLGGGECWLAGTSWSGPQRSDDTGVILESIDSGTTWNAVQLPASIGSVDDVSCPSGNSCFAIAGPSPASPTAESSQEVLTNSRS